MRALCWNGANDVRVETTPDSRILNPHDAIVRVTLTAICGSDLHLYDGYIPTMQPGDILGHEFMGEVVEVGSEVTNLKKGDRVVTPFNISCGHCFFCKHDMWSLCDNSNPKPELIEKLYSYAGGGLFGYSHMMGGYAGGQFAIRSAFMLGAIQACRKGGTVSIPGVYGGFIDKMPMGAAFGKGLTLKMGQTHTHRYMRPLLERIERGEIDPSFVITHRFNLEEAPHAYEIFKHKQDDCIKVVLTP